MAVIMTPSYSCSNNNLEVRWPTDLVFTEDVKEIPTKVQEMLSSSMKNLDKRKQRS